MDQREERERWRIVDRFTKAVEDLVEQREYRQASQRELIAAIEELLEVLGTREKGLVHKLLTMPNAVAGEVSDKLNTDAIDLIRHVRYWIGEINNAHPGADPRKLGPVPPAGSGAFAVHVETPAKDEITSVFALEHTDGRKRKAQEIVGKVVVWLGIKAWETGLVTGLIKVVLGAGAAAALYTWFHKVWP